VKDVLARSATVDVEVVDPAGRRVEPFAQEDTDESDLAAGPRSDSNRDLVEALLLALFDVDVSTESRRDRGGEVVSSELLGSLEDGEVPIGDIDGLVRHVDIVTPVGLARYM
jgi:hypothetical protein